MSGCSLRMECHRAYLIGSKKLTSRLELVYGCGR
jgi:hypothetical protein